ncbi:MAG: hypothetical protein NTX65_01095 [Ignavibacteriales bacterium]|nr:hypothetical protein [Ignavibacteriales bacterium]
MKKIFLNHIYILFILFTPAFLFPQIKNSVVIRDTIQIRSDNFYKISSLIIIPHTENIVLRGKTLLNSEYEFNYSTGSFSLSPHLTYSLLDTLFVRYESVKLSLQKEYKRRSLVIEYNEKSLDIIRSSKKIGEPLTSESIFGKDLHKSGAIIRGFTIGTNRDFTLNSGLRLQLSGKLSDDIELVAALTDENTPIQPEGNTETLDELDKVFIELRHKNAIGTFGDYELNLRENEFSQVTRKLQGLKGEVLYESSNGTIAIAGSRGKFTTNQFSGMDGNQGPYRLNGINNEREIIVIAGSERVYIDGEQMKRGENNDYIIDYSNSEITFTAKRLITSASRISIDFEYSDQKFKRNFLGTDFSTKILDERVKIGVSYFREGDDENNPIEYTFNENDLNILKLAGNDRNAATRSGVVLALPDSTGKVHGIYSKIDTLINSQQYTYYKYLPGALSAIYNVSFSYVGESFGDYTKESLGNYRFVGIKNGSYLPLIYLPMPELKQLGNFSAAAILMEGVTLSAELTGSNWDQNRFSSIGDDSNSGYARKIFFEVNQREIKVGNSSLGKIGFSFKDRFIQGRFSSLDRINDVEFNRNYNLPVLVAEDQTLREISLIYSPIQLLSLITKYGYLKQGDDFSSDRLYSQLNFGNKKDYQLDYDLDYVNSTNNMIHSNWLRQNGNVFYTFGSFKPGMNFIYEDKEERLASKDSLLSSSLKYSEASPYIDFTISSVLDSKFSFSLRDESFPLNGQLRKQSTSTTEQMQFNYHGLKEFSTSLNMTFRNKIYTDDFKIQGYGDNETVLLLSQSRFNLWNGFISGDIYYQAATEQIAKFERVFVKVPKGTGNYIYLGDLNNNGIQEENEFQITAYDGEYSLITIPTEKLFPVMALKTNTRLKIDFNKAFKNQNIWSDILKSISTETSFRIEENSKDPETKNIYLLHFSKFLNDSTTIQGSQLFQHDFNIFQNSNELSFRLRFTQRKSLNQFNGGIENGFFRERGFRIKFKMVEEISNQTEFINQIDNLLSPATTNRARLVTRNNLSSDFSYRPQHDIEVGFKIESGKSEDTYPIFPSSIDMNSVLLHANFSFENLGRLRIEVERTELISSSNSFNLPFEMTRGNVIGKNYFWRVFFDYRISSLVQLSFSYDARKQGESRVIQTMRAEAKAYF